MTEISLVSCVKTKRSEPATPKELYTSDYFQKMRAYAEQYHDDWWILSAKHGLLDPDGEPIEPLINTEWCESSGKTRLVRGDSRAIGRGRTAFGRRDARDSREPDYYEELLPLIEDTGVNIEIPTEGLQIGKTKAWYKERL